jgi:nucleotide-binding universal stress UspA family protein
MKTHIIVPLDGSPLSHAALPLARGLAAQLSAQITLISVIKPPNDMFLVPQDAGSTRMTPRDVERMSGEHSELEDYVAGVKATFADAEVHSTVRIGSPAQEILELAESVDNPLIVMGSHGRSGIGQALLGSVATQVVHHASCPVIITRSPAGYPTEHGTKNVEKIMIPLDGSEFAEQSLHTVEHIFGASVRLYLVRIVEPLAPGVAYTPDTVMSYDRQAREASREYLNQVESMLNVKGYDVSSDVHGDTPVRGIINAADDVNADMIAISTHGRTGFLRFVMGSVAERVIREAKKPVMVVRCSDLK